MKTKNPSIGTLADLVVNTAKTDTTSPDPQNLRNGWMTDLLLTQMIDRLVVGRYNDPAAYAEIGRQVLNFIGDLPEAAVLAQLAIFRGERLLPLTSEREQSALQMIRGIEQTIEALPEGTRRMRCKSLFDYHRGILYDACGYFDLAANLQLDSAAEALRLGDRNGFTIGTFMAGISLLKYALREGKSEDQIVSRFSEIENYFGSFVSELKGSPFEILWAQVNGPVFMLEACVWLNRGHPKWNEWVQTSLAGMKKLGKSWNLCADFVRAVDIAKREDARAVDALNVVAESSDANERRSAALLILVRRALGRGDTEKAKEIISRMPEQGAQHVIAAAKRYIE